ncbi:allophanate hydrolase subunit 1 [Bacillus sp. OxB-1]|uniref:5-oxoprolinase subunit PxpB n=1 Tax=Bacillus sp. (strain OxB-1) TaxID=98228 RepID=UPI000581CDDC|nr:5-oxoprolinase subunit PxpB [Bacillus sp. OxB-1]BAQ10629.1 allophanate hydrolase subunit 1 [Bacillus sp. OxB-1]
MQNYPLIQPLGDSALFVQLGEGIAPAIHEKVKNLLHLLTEHPFEGWIECVPAYNNITVYYDPTQVLRSLSLEPGTSFQKVSAYIQKLLQQSEEQAAGKGRTVTIPVLYGGEYGPDLAHVAEANGLTTDEVIQIHSENEYLVYMIGFAPGFPFMGGMDERIATPRKESPRMAIHPGSVGIAGKQTGIYPLETPGGWQIIGRTPIDLFLPEQTPPTLLQAGDIIRFAPISPVEYNEIKEGKR